MTNTINYSPKIVRNKDKVIKALIIIFIVIFVISSFIYIIFNSAMVTIFNIKNFERSFLEHNSAEDVGTDYESLVRVMQHTLDYLDGKVENLQIQIEVEGTTINFYTDNEISHMKDVYVLIHNIKVAGTIFAVLGLVSFIFFLFFSSYMSKSKLKAILKGYGLCLIFILTIVLVACIDFTAAFDVFHKIFFPQGNWMFPASSLMIQMLPADLFMNFTINILALSGLSFVSVITFIKLLISKKDMLPRIDDNFDFNYKHELNINEVNE